MMKMKMVQPVPTPIINSLSDLAIKNSPDWLQQTYGGAVCVCRVVTGSCTIPSQAEDKPPMLIQENTMDTTVSHETKARTHLERDLRNQYFKHDEELERHFGTRDDVHPKTAEDALERIKSGKFHLVDKDCRGFFDDWSSHIRWRDPEKKKDLEGYRAASEKLKTAYLHVQQDVACDPLDKAKASVRKFEDTPLSTYH